MLSSVSQFVSRRQRGLTVLASVAGGAYLLVNYAKQRFADLSERLVLDRAAKENLRRRFQQNQEDCAFTVLALLPTLSKQVLEELDVEALTAELQRRALETKKAKTPALTPAGEGSATPNVQDSTASLQPEADAAEQTALEAANIPLPAEEVAEQHPLQEEQPSAQQRDGNKASEMNGHAQSPDAEASPTPPPDPRTKAELWQATKILTFQRTITSLYVLSLVALQTHIQLNLLGRHNYVSSVYEQASSSTPSSTGDLPLEGFNGLQDGLDLDHGRKLAEGGGIDALTERQYLTFSWWLIQRGWRLVSDRVREACEEALESVSLKASLSLQDSDKLLLEIRRKVEYESTGAVHSFAPAVFPTSLSEEEETLRESGLTFDSEDGPQPKVSPPLRILLNETQDFVDSPDFSTVLRSTLDRSFALLSASLGHLFVDPTASPGSQAAQRRFVELSDKKVRLAAVLPALARASHAVFMSLPNEYAEAIADNRELMEFSAVVYSNFLIEEQ